MRIAVTRALSPRIRECELSYIDRQPIEFQRAAAQHDGYERALAAHGCTIVHAEPEPDMPDAVFVEDAAVVLDDVAIVTRPGAVSRRSEPHSIAHVLRRYRALRHVEEPATVDGGDVLVIENTLYIGISQRTNDAAVKQLGATPVRFSNCLHLKSAVTLIGERTLLANRDWVDTTQFPGFDVIDVEEPFGANALRIGDTLLYSASYPRTRRRLEARGFRVEALQVDELEKAEAGVTCCSIIFEV
jgi:dimethylargininase